MNIKSSWVVAALLVAALAGCDKAQSPSEPSAPSGATPAPAPEKPAVEVPATEKWLGQWNGPEGTFLRLSGGKGQYDITIQNLDGPREFKGRAAGDRIEFERDGVKETIRATNGTETGMKWLADRKDCLTVRAGEGYCRG